MAADQCDQPYCMGKKGGSEELAHGAIYRYGPLAEWRGLRVLGVALSALSTFDAVPRFILAIRRKRSRHFGAGLSHGLLCRVPAFHARL